MKKIISVRINKTGNIPYINKVGPIDTRMDLDTLVGVWCAMKHFYHGSKMIQIHESNTRAVYVNNDVIRALRINNETPFSDLLNVSSLVPGLFGDIKNIKDWDITCCSTNLKIGQIFGIQHNCDSLKDHRDVMDHILQNMNVSFNDRLIERLDTNRFRALSHGNTMLTFTNDMLEPKTKMIAVQIEEPKYPNRISGEILGNGGDSLEPIILKLKVLDNKNTIFGGDYDFIVSVEDKDNVNIVELDRDTFEITPVEPHDMVITTHCNCERDIAPITTRHTFKTIDVEQIEPLERKIK
ncbi:MAG: hypothetical protein ACRCZ9_12055 [Fusobacteriaceae bacterium]